MQTQQRKDLLVRLSEYMMSKDEPWEQVKRRAQSENNWFIPEFVDLAIKNIVDNYLQPIQLDQLINTYQLPAKNAAPKKVGIVMAGNVPLVGFHDFLCVFISGHIAAIKPSSKDEVLIKHLVGKLIEWEPALSSEIILSELLKGCDAYIATGSNNSGRYFEYYFQKYPHIIRKNRTSIAILRGNESKEELEKLADDVHLYFGLGCRNVTKLYVPQAFDFIPLLDAFRKYHYLINHNKYKNNYDYNLSLHILNNRFYMTNGSVLIVEDASPFSPISQIHFEYYENINDVQKNLHDNESIQCVVGDETTGFGTAQLPQVCDYADGVDTMAFLKNLS